MAGGEGSKDGFWERSLGSERAYKCKVVEGALERWERSARPVEPVAPRMAYVGMSMIYTWICMFLNS